MEESDIKFQENPWGGSRADTLEQTDGQTEPIWQVLLTNIRDGALQFTKWSKESGSWYMYIGRCKPSTMSAY